MRQYSIAFLFLISMTSSFSQLPLSAGDHSLEKAYGFISMGTEIPHIPPMYVDAMPFSEGLAAVKKGEKWGFIDVNNQPIIPFRFDDVRSFRMGLSIAREGEWYGVINQKGQWVIPPRYYDLTPYKLEGKSYFISRNQSFFQGIIDLEGNVVLPHRYIYVMTLEPNIISGKGFYPNIPFYTVFQEIDTSKQSFYQQFSADAYEFAPEKGMHTLHDLQFNELASRLSTHLADGFQHDELVLIDAYLETNKNLPLEQKVAAIDSLLGATHTTMNQSEISSQNDLTLQMNDTQLAAYIDSLGYRFFTENGKTGLKKEGDTLILAQHTVLKPISAVIRFPREEDLPILRTHYGGRYRDQDNGVFEFLVLIPHDEEIDQANVQYSLSGEIELPVRKRDKQGVAVLTKISPFGFQYLHTRQARGNETIRTYEMVDWQGRQILPPVYRKIEIIKPGVLLVTQERAVKGGLEEHFALLDSYGRTLVPLGTYSDIRPFTQSGAENLFLAIWSDPYPTIAEKKKGDYTNQTYVILKVEHDGNQVIHSFIAAGPVNPTDLDMETGMLRYGVNSHADDR